METYKVLRADTTPKCRWYLNTSKPFMPKRINEFENEIDWLKLPVVVENLLGAGSPPSPTPGPQLVHNGTTPSDVTCQHRSSESNPTPAHTRSYPPGGKIVCLPPNIDTSSRHHFTSHILCPPWSHPHDPNGESNKKW